MGGAVLLGVLTGGCAPMIDYEDAVTGLEPTELIEIDSRRIHVRQWGDGGEPILLIHGFGVSSYAFRELGPLLGRTNRVAALDLHGFGYTERPEEAEAYSLDGQSALICQVREQLGFRRAHLVGHSYGGYLAMRLAESDPDSCGAVVLVSPALDVEVAPSGIVRSPLFRQAMYPALKATLSSQRMFRSLYERAYFDQTVLTEDVSEEYRRQLRVEGLDRAYRGFGSSLGELADGKTTKLDRLSVPVVVIGGRQDQVIPVEALEKELASIDEVDLRVIEDSGHSIPEEKPEAVAREIRRFLRSHPISDS